MTAAEERAEIMERLERIEGKVDQINGTVKDHEVRLTKTEDYIEELHVIFSKTKKVIYYVAAAIVGSMGAQLPHWFDLFNGTGG